MFEDNGSRIKRFGKPEKNHVDETLLNWLKQQKRDNEAVIGLIYKVVQI
jgi:hypothetical protein